MKRGDLVEKDDDACMRHSVGHETLERKVGEREGG